MFLYSLIFVKQIAISIAVNNSLFTIKWTQLFLRLNYTLIYPISVNCKEKFTTYLIISFKGPKKKGKKVYNLSGKNY